MQKFIVVTIAALSPESLRECFNWLRIKKAQEVALVETTADRGLTIQYFIARKKEPTDPVRIQRKEIRPESIIATWKFGDGDDHTPEFNPNVAGHFRTMLKDW